MEHRRSRFCRGVNVTYDAQEGQVSTSGFGYYPALKLMTRWSFRSNQESNDRCSAAPQAQAAALRHYAEWRTGP
jgi:hypothetical protein